MLLVINWKFYVNNMLGNGLIVFKGYVFEDLVKNLIIGKDFMIDVVVFFVVDYNLMKVKKLWKEGLKEIGEIKLNIKLFFDDMDVGKKVIEFI